MELARGECWNELAAMNLDGTIEGRAGEGPLGVIWQYRVTVQVDGIPVHLMGEGETIEDAACNTLGLVRRYGG